MWTRNRAGKAGWAGAILLVLGISVSLGAAPAPPKSLRLYIFDCGVIKGLSVELFGFKPGEVPARDFFVPCYLVVHPKGTLMWDVGVVADSAFKDVGVSVTEGRSTVSRPLLPQLAAGGYTPPDITYLSMSHYHPHHTANANVFAGSTSPPPLAGSGKIFRTP